MKIDPDAPAYPQRNKFSMRDPSDKEHIITIDMPGMTIRAKMASMAMQGVLGSRNGFLVDCGTENAATWAVQAADNLIAEMNKEQPGTCQDAVIQELKDENARLRSEGKALIAELNKEANACKCSVNSQCLCAKCQAEISAKEAPDA